MLIENGMVANVGSQWTFFRIKTQHPSDEVEERRSQHPTRYVLTQIQSNWLPVLNAGNRISPERVKSVQKNKPTNASETKEVKRRTNWVLRVGGAHPSFGRDQTKLRESIRFISDD